MYTPLQLAWRYARWWLRASNSKGHGMHSPHVFRLITEVFNDRDVYPEYEKVEALRNTLYHDPRSVQVRELGAGSRVNGPGTRLHKPATGPGSATRSVSSIARHAAKPAKLARLLFRLARFYQPGLVIELGTSLGISCSYLSVSVPGAEIYTLEGSPDVASIAGENFSGLGLANITQVTGNFDDTLPLLLGEIGLNPRVPAKQLFFIDGNHRLDPTLAYFHQLLSISTGETVMIFDDIHWSAGMEQAWDRIRSHPAVRCTVDLFFIGIVLFRPEFREKQHFNVRF